MRLWSNLDTKHYQSKILSKTTQEITFQSHPNQLELCHFKSDSFIMKNYVVASFYRFCELLDYEDIKPPLLAMMKNHNILGTIILAQEGINGGMAGKRADMDAFYAYIRSDQRFADIRFKETSDDMMPFDKAKVKLRKEIVTLGVAGVNPLQQTGTRLSPTEWNALLADPDVLLIDTRNTYEVELGTFKNAINPQTENFRDFPSYVENNLLDKKDKKIAMCCTGGIRCEKSTAYLKMLGFEDVYQLEGGILDYLQSTSPEESLWQGECFVFDERIAIANLHKD